MESSNECVNVITQNCLSATFHRKVSICKTLYQFCLLIILKFPFHYYFTNWSRNSSLPYQAQWIHMNVEDPGWWRGLWSQRSDWGYGEVNGCKTKGRNPCHSTHQRYLVKCNASMTFYSMPRWALLRSLGKHAADSTRLGDSAVKNLPTSACQCRRLGFDPRVGKIPRRRKWQPAAVFLPRKSHMNSQFIGKMHDGGKDWRQKEKRETEMRCLGDITNSMDVNLGKLQEVVRDREA